MSTRNACRTAEGALVLMGGIVAREVDATPTRVASFSYRLHNASTCCQHFLPSFSPVLFDFLPPLCIDSYSLAQCYSLYGSDMAPPGRRRLVILRRLIMGALVSLATCQAFLSFSYSSQRIATPNSTALRMHQLQPPLNTPLRFGCGSRRMLRLLAGEKGGEEDALIGVRRQRGGWEEVRERALASSGKRGDVP